MGLNGTVVIFKLSTAKMASSLDLSYCNSESKKEGCQWLCTWQNVKWNIMGSAGVCLRGQWCHQKDMLVNLLKPIARTKPHTPQPPQPDTTFNPLKCSLCWSIGCHCLKVQGSKNQSATGSTGICLVNMCNLKWNMSASVRLHQVSMKSHLWLFQRRTMHCDSTWFQLWTSLKCLIIWSEFYLMSLGKLCISGVTVNLIARNCSVIISYEMLMLLHLNCYNHPTW